MCGPGARRQRSNMAPLTIGTCNAHLSDTHGPHPATAAATSQRRPAQHHAPQAPRLALSPQRLHCPLSQRPVELAASPRMTTSWCVAKPPCGSPASNSNAPPLSRLPPTSTTWMSGCDKSKHRRRSTLQQPPSPDASTGGRLWQILGRIVQQPPADTEPAPFLRGCDISWVLAAAAASPNPHIRAAAASQAAAVPTRAMYFLIRDDVGFARAAAIAHPRTAKIVLIHAQRDPDDDVRAAAAGHHRLGPNVCCRFAADRSERVCTAGVGRQAGGPLLATRRGIDNLKLLPVEHAGG